MRVRVVSAGRGSVDGMMSMICSARSLHVGYTCLALVFMCIEMMCIEMMCIEMMCIEMMCIERAVAYM